MDKIENIKKSLVECAKFTFIFLLLIFLSTYCFCQKSIEPIYIYNKIHDLTPQYQRQAKAITKDILRKYSTFDEFKDDLDFFGEFDHTYIPMFDLSSRIKDYSNGDNILNYIRIGRRTNFNSIIIFKSGEYYATCSRTEFLPYSIIKPESKYDTTRSYVKQLEIISPYKEYFIFYIRGFLFTWWLINEEGKIMVLNLRNDKLYEYDDFMSRFFSLEEIKIIIENYYTKH